MRAKRDKEIINKIITLLQAVNVTNHGFKFSLVLKGLEPVAKNMILPVCYVYYLGGDTDLQMSRPVGTIGNGIIQIGITSVITTNNPMRKDELIDNTLNVKNAVEQVFQENGLDEQDNCDVLGLSYKTELQRIETRPFYDWENSICELDMILTINYWEI
jgi:hypothetical protein